jgi:hypothetical protein
VSVRVSHFVSLHGCRLLGRALCRLLAGLL